MPFEVVARDGLKLFKCSALKSRHAFSTRSGGVSETPFDSLNLGLSAGDEPARVHSNRARFVAAAGFAGGVAIAHQVHGAQVNEPPILPGTQGDVIVTDRCETPIGVFVADCVPILIEDVRTGAVAAVHAGWRGTAQRAVVAAVRELESRYGARAADLVAAIGPSVGACCYQVGDEVVAELGHLSDRDACVRREAAGTYLDLQAANRQLLDQAGVGAVHVSGLCTSCEAEWFFSYRRDGARSGRMLAAIQRDFHH